DRRRRRRGRSASARERRRPSLVASSRPTCHNPSPMATADPLARLNTSIVRCRRCPRLVAHREAAAADPPRRYRGQRYWARPLPGFGDPRARLLLIGLPLFGHAAVTRFTDGTALIGSYHPSQQNTFTGKLTRPMLRKVFATARALLEG